MHPDSSSVADGAGRWRLPARRTWLRLHALLTLALLALDAAAEPPPPPGAEPAASVTIEATRKRGEVEQQISHFVSSITVNGMDEPLARWQTPICPLVSGLPREQGESVLRRISQIAHDAGAPLDTPDCKAANLLLIVTSDPEELLKQW